MAADRAKLRRKAFAEFDLWPDRVPENDIEFAPLEFYHRVLITLASVADSA
jgi:hypothetical protein